MNSSNGHKADIDLSSLMPDAAPLTIQVGETVYTSNLDVSAVFYERVVAWCNGLLTADPDEADAASINLVAGAFNVSEAEAAEMRPRLRRSMLLFFVSGRVATAKEST